MLLCLGRIAVVALFVVAIAASPVRAEESFTPTPDAPEPSLCQAPPRALAELNALSATPIAAAGPTRTPGVLPKGLPADPDQIAGVTATVRELVACFNAGELLRAYGLYTDGYLHRLFARQGPLTAEAYDALATPEPEAPNSRAAILDLRNARILEDGAVGATVTINYAVIPVPKTFFFTFVYEDGRWWIDDILGELSFSLP
jgi:hypothetical protein